MKFKTFILGPLILLLNLNSNAQDTVKNSELENSILESDSYTPPPSFSCSNAMTLKECVTMLCNTSLNKFGTYKLILFETLQCYAVGLFPTNKEERIIYENSKNNQSNQEPKYCPLSKNEFFGLDYMKVVNKIRLEFKEFSNTDKFLNSFLARNKSLSIKFDDGYLLKIK